MQLLNRAFLSLPPPKLPSTCRSRESGCQKVAEANLDSCSRQGWTASLPPISDPCSWSSRSPVVTRGMEGLPCLLCHVPKDVIQTSDSGGQSCLSPYTEHVRILRCTTSYFPCLGHLNRCKLLRSPLPSISTRPNLI